MLYTYNNINRHAGTPDKTKQNHCSTHLNIPGRLIIILVYDNIIVLSTITTMRASSLLMAWSAGIIFYLYWYSYIVHFVCDSPSEFGAMGSTSFLGFSYPNLLLVFLNMLLLGTCVIFFSQVLDFL